MTKRTRDEDVCERPPKKLCTVENKALLSLPEKSVAAKQVS
jgi:hypothetical protein